MKKCLVVVTFICGMFTPMMPSAAPIDQEVANMYNDGIVRCINEDCAKYLYACFRSYSAGPVQEFLNCGSQAERLNNDKMVVPRS